MVKSHNKSPEADFEKRNYRWTYVPFYAVVYRMLRQSEGAKDLRAPMAQSPLQRLTKRAIGSATRLLMSKRIDARLRNEFAGLD